MSGKGRLLLRLLRLAAALGVILPPALHLARVAAKPEMKAWMLAATLLWFAVAPLRK